MAKVLMIPLDQIKNEFDVRTKLNDDRILQFMGMYEAGEPVPPVVLIKRDDDSYSFVDGRHRAAARAESGFKDVEAVIRSNNLPDSRFELLAVALESNWGGALPPTRDDIVHTIQRMLEAGSTQKAVRDRLVFLPKGSLSAYVHHALSNIYKRKVIHALDDIETGEITVADAASKWGLKTDSLKDVIAGKKKIVKGRNAESQYIAELKMYVNNQLRSANSGIAQKMGELLKKVNDGEVSANNAEEVIRGWREHLRKTGVRASDWQSRLNALSGEADKAAEAKV